MKELSITDLTQIINAEPVTNTGFCTAVGIDSRTVKAGDCFFAIAGENFDGHDYVSQALANGAACAVVEKDVTTNDSADGKVLKVKDTVKALGDLAGYCRQQAEFKVVAITGSVGKTTTRQIAHHILSQYFRVIAAPKNFNNHIGLPLTLLAADGDHEIVITELGANAPGDISYLTQIACPDIAVVTNAYPAHLEGFGDLGTIVREKLSILKGLRPGGDFVINADCQPLLGACRAAELTFSTFGQSDDCDLLAENVSCNGLSSQFTIEGVKIELPLPGPGNVENALAAWAICSWFGISLDDFADSLKTQPGVPMRAEPLTMGTLAVINDCYNANPASMKNALQILTNFGPDEIRRTVFICGSMAELGEQSRRLHTELGKAVAQAEVQLLVTIGTPGKIVARTAKEYAKYDLEIKLFDDTLSTCNGLEKIIKDYDIVLVKGSRVNKLEMVVEKLGELFSQNTPC